MLLLTVQNQKEAANRKAVPIVKHSLTIALTTARQEPKFDWFLRSLENQLHEGDPVKVIIVDLLFGKRGITTDFQMVPVKPNVWQGEHRLTTSDYWAKSAALNTAICLCKSDWMAFCDDRAVLMPGWLDAIKRAMKGNYAVCGSYEKRSGMTVTDGVITNPGTLIGEDPRKKSINHQMWKLTGGAWGNAGQWFGCTNALPLEWALQVNGYDESCDSMRYEDTTFGGMLAENGYPIKYDPRMGIVEDRTTGHDALVKSQDKGVSPNDKSHALLRRVAGKKQATHHWNLREIREKVLRGEPFPIPNQPTHDWYDYQLLSEFP